MNQGTAKSLAIYVAAFGVAAMAGWGGKTALRHSPVPTAKALPAQIAAVVPEDPDDLSELDTRVALAEALVDADAARMRAIADGLLNKKGADFRVWSTVFSRWVKLAPEAAWSFANQHPEATYLVGDYNFGPEEKYEKGHLRTSAIQAWALVDPRAARAALGPPPAAEFGILVAAAMQADVEYGFALLAEQPDAGSLVPEDPFRDPFQQYVAKLAVKNPQLALEWATRLGPKRYFPPLLIGWAASDWNAAVEWLDQQPDPVGLLTETAEFLCRNCALYQPKLFDLMVGRLPAGNRKVELIRQILEELAWADPVRAAAEAGRALPDPETRAEALADIAKNLARSNPALAWDLLSRINPKTAGDRRINLPTAEVVVDGEPRDYFGPTGLQMDLVSWGAGTTADEVKGEILDSLIWTDKAQALRLLAQCPPDKIASVGSRMIENWTEFDPIEAATWLADKVGESGEDLDIENWFYDSNLTAEETTTLIESLAPGVFRDKFVAWAAAEMVAEDPAAALAVARADGGNAEAIAEVYGGWARKDPQAALASLTADEGATPATWTGVAEGLLAAEPEQTRQLAEDMEPGANRDAVLKVLAAAERNQGDCRQRAAWASGITDETDRRRILNSALDDMTLDLRAGSDPATADSLRELIETAGEMSADEKARWSARVDLLFPPPP